MSIIVDTNMCSVFCASSVCNDRVIPISVSPIEFARGNGSNNMHKYPPLQISKIVISSLKCTTPSKEYHSPKSIPTIKLK